MASLSVRVPASTAVTFAPSSLILPTLGALAGDPKVTPKDVIKAAANVAADGTVEPGDAVQFISGMPPDPDKLRPWLKSLYAANLSAVVHMKAAMLQGPQGQPQGGNAPPQPAAAPAAPTSMTPGVAP